MWERKVFEAGDELPGPGETLRIVRFLADGGFSEVYEAVGLITGTYYAVKALRPKHRSNQKTQERQNREAKTLFLLKNPNVVRVHHIGRRPQDNLVYMVMDLLIGRTVRELQRDFSATNADGGLLAPQGRLPVVWVLEILKSVCAGLEALHKYDAIHRDLKPENVYVCDDGRVCLLDIGSAFFANEARLTTNDVTIGTATYMSPEQLRSPHDMDGRSDLFNIGIMLYELFSGIHPFSINGVMVGDRMALGLRIISQPHRPLREAAPHLETLAPHLRDFIVNIVERLLCKDPSGRYASARIVRNHLSTAHAALIKELGELAPPSLADAISRIPRAPVEPEDPPSVSLPAATNPFVTVSLPPDAPTSNVSSAVDDGDGQTAELPAVPLPARRTEAVDVDAEGDRAASFPLSQVRPAPELPRVRLPGRAASTEARRQSSSKAAPSRSRCTRVRA